MLLVFSESDRSTWTLAALKQKSMLGLARLQLNAGTNYHSRASRRSETRCRA